MTPSVIPGSTSLSQRPGGICISWKRWMLYAEFSSSSTSSGETFSYAASISSLETAMLSRST